MLRNVEVTCPNCSVKRIVQNWNDKKLGGPPCIRLCRVCTQLLNQTDEVRKRKSEALKGRAKPPEYSERLKKRHEEDPSLKEHLIPGAGAGHNKGKSTGPRSEETKKKISDSMKKTLNEDGDQQ